MRNSAAALAAILLVGVGFYFYRRYQSGLTIWPTKARPTVAGDGFQKSRQTGSRLALGRAVRDAQHGTFESGVLRTIPSEDVSVAKADLG